MTFLLIMLRMLGNCSKLFSPSAGINLQNRVNKRVSPPPLLCASAPLSARAAASSVSAASLPATHCLHALNPPPGCNDVTLSGFQNPPFSVSINGPAQSEARGFVTVSVFRMATERGNLRYVIGLGTPNVCKVWGGEKLCHVVRQRLCVRQSALVEQTDT